MGIFNVFGLSVILAEVFSKVGEGGISGGITVHPVSESLGIESQSNRTGKMFDSGGGDGTDCTVLDGQVLETSASWRLWLRESRRPFEIGKVDITADRLVVGGVNEVKTFTGSLLGAGIGSD